MFIIFNLNKEELRMVDPNEWDKYTNIIYNTTNENSMYVELCFIPKDIGKDKRFIDYLLSSYNSWNWKVKIIFEFCYLNSENIKKSDSFIRDKELFHKYFLKYGPIILKYGSKKNKIYSDKKIILDALKDGLPYKNFLLNVSSKLSCDSDILKRLEELYPCELTWSMTDENCEAILQHYKNHSHLREYSHILEENPKKKKKVTFN